MRRRLIPHRQLLAALALALTVTLSPAPPPPLPAPPARAAVAAGVSTGPAFASAVPCLSGSPAFAVTRYDNTLHGASTPAVYPALQTVTPGSAPSTQASMADLGAVYGLAYDDGAASGRERLFAAAYTKRLANYRAGNAGEITVFERSGGGWARAGSFSVPGAVGVPRSGSGDPPVDTAATGGVGFSGLGDLVVSPDGRSLYVVNIGVVTAGLGEGRTRRGRIEQFSLPAAGMPTHVGSIPISYDRISADSAVVHDLTPFALAWYNYPESGTPLLLLGVTDTARRGLQPDGTPAMAGANFAVPPRAHVLLLDPLGARWIGTLSGASLDLGNDPDFAGRHEDAAYTSVTWPPTLTPYPVRGWNPWRDHLAGIAGLGQEMHYAQPWLTDIEIVRDAAPTAGTPEPRGLVLLGLRDRTGDQAFNGGIAVPTGERSAIAQGDTVVLRWNGSSYVRQAGDFYNDSALAYPGSAPRAHLENHLGALARLPGAGTGIGSAGDTLVATALGGQNHQGLRSWADSAATGGAGSYTDLIDAASHAATKATNLGDVEVLCSYALVGGRVWDDANMNSLQDAGETGINDIVLDVTTRSGTGIAQARTDSQGRYLFAVPPNTSLDLRLNLAASGGGIAGYRLTRENVGGSDTADSDVPQLGGYLELVRPGDLARTAAPIAAPWRDSDQRSFDIGLTRAMPTSRIGDQVWLDTNRDGLQNESPLAGYQLGGTVTLRALSTEPGVVNRTTAVRADGRYAIDNVVPGTYRLEFPAPPSGFEPAPQDRGGDDARDSDPSTGSFQTAPFTVLDDTPQLQWDFGLIGGADLGISKVGPATALAGAEVAYTLTVTNRSGGVTARAVTLVDDLPPLLAYVAATPAPSSSAGGRLSWSLGDLAPGQSLAVTLRLRAPLAFDPPNDVRESVQNCASVSTTTVPDLSPGDNSACVSTELQRPELAISKSATSAVTVGSRVSYTLAYTNSGSAPAPGLLLTDALPPATSFAYFVTNPGNACVHSAGTITCRPGTLVAGDSGRVRFDATVVSMTDALTNQVTLAPDPASGASWPGEHPADNQAQAGTVIIAPDLGVTVTLDPGTGGPPTAFPVGVTGTLTLDLGNGGRAHASGVSFITTLDPGVSLGALPSLCLRLTNTASGQPRVRCRHHLVFSQPLYAGEQYRFLLPVRLPATPLDGATFPAETVLVTATVTSSTPERPSDLANNQALAAATVMRPNVWATVQAVGKSVTEEGVRYGRPGWLTLVRFRVGYGNDAAHADSRRARTYPREQTWPAQGSVLTMTLPRTADLVDVTDTAGQPVAGVTPGTDGEGAPTLSWSPGTLAAGAEGALFVTVRVREAAGATIALAAGIATSSPGDDPADNTGADTTSVEAPPSIPAATGALRLAIHSALDPQHGGASPTDAVHLASGSQIAWPAGEVLDLTPRLAALSVPDVRPPGDDLSAYGLRARLLGWRLVSSTLNDAPFDPRADADAAGRRGCRGGGGTPAAGAAGCAYAYPGASPEGREPDQAVPPLDAVTETDMATQARLYWTHRGLPGTPLPSLPAAVYLHTLEPLAPVALTVAVDVELWVVTLYPRAPLGDWTEDPQELTSIPRERRPITDTVTVTLLVPRSVVGPGE